MGKVYCSVSATANTQNKTGVTGRQGPRDSAFGIRLSKLRCAHIASNQQRDRRVLVEVELNESLCHCSVRGKGTAGEREQSVEAALSNGVRCLAGAVGCLRGLGATAPDSAPNAGHNVARRWPPIMMGRVNKSFSGLASYANEFHRLCWLSVWEIRKKETVKGTPFSYLRIATKEL